MFNLKKVYRFEAAESPSSNSGKKSSQENAAYDQTHPPTKPLIGGTRRGRKVRSNFPGMQYVATEETKFYSMSDKIGRNYTPSSRGISLSNLNDILAGRQDNDFPMPDFADSASTDHRPLNVRAAKRPPPTTLRSSNEVYLWSYYRGPCISACNRRCGRRLIEAKQVTGEY